MIRTVTVYEDPITRQKPEGKAVIIRKIGRPDIDLGQRCVVRFIDEPGDDQVVERWVAESDIHAR